MLIREAQHGDLLKLLELYIHLHDNTMPAIDQQIENLWSAVVDDPNHHIVVGVIDNTIISSCALMIVPNLTHQQRPYATQILKHAKKIAVDRKCYKIMLMTGSKADSTLSFYERAGYNRNDKTAFIQWLG